MRVNKWIGYRMGDPTWTDGSPFGAFTRWRLGEPNGPSGFCVQMHDNGEWNDIECDSILNPGNGFRTDAFVCKRVVDAPRQSDPWGSGVADPRGLQSTLSPVEPEDDERRSPAMDTAPKRILQKAVLALDAAHVKYAVGGGAALEAHGYRRTVEDLDVFVSPEQSATALDAVGAAGFMIEPVLAPGHYAAVETKHVRKLDPARCLALRFPTENSEHAATLAHETRRVGGKMVKVFPLVLLVAAKWYSNGPEDDLDFEALLNRGAHADPERARSCRRH